MQKETVNLGIYQKQTYLQETDCAWSNMYMLISKHLAK